MKNANVRVLLIAFALIAAVAAAAALLPQAPPSPAGTMEGVVITPAIPEPAADTVAYVRIQVGGESWPLIPLTDGGEYTVFQIEKGARNVVRTTREGAVMHFSTCDNQNCVDQHEVTLDNRETRVMGSLIVCLPNQVIVELFSAGEVE